MSGSPLPQPVKVSNALLRERFQKLEAREGLTLADVAQRIGWETRDRRTGRLKPDSSRVAKSLGLVATNGEHRTELTENNAVTIGRALHLDPWEIGL